MYDPMQMFSMMRNSRNPQAVMEQMIKSNPQVKNIVDMVNASGDPKSLFYKLAQERGVDPNTILSKLR